MPTFWRIVKSPRASTAFDGEGARLCGGRWNRLGTPMVYLAESRSLAALELLTQLRFSQLLNSYTLIPAKIDSDLIEIMDVTSLPANWKSSPPPSNLQTFGDVWVSENRTAALQVPSAVMPAESNLLLNPTHPDFSKVEIGSFEPYQFDSRLKQGNPPSS